ncbi:MAG: DUF2188 domain-containing protein [Clostridia bacterium]
MRCSIVLREHHVVSNIHGGLDVKRNSFHTAIIHTNTKATAIEQGSILSKVESTGFIIHGKDERNQRSERHGNDLESLRG